MVKYVITLGVIALLSFIATPAHAQSALAGKHIAIPVLSDKVCCECCASYGPCGCQICSYCPLVKTGHEVERSVGDLDKLQSLGVRVYYSSQPLMAGKSQKCPKIDALLNKK
jgi:hypothetical protein